MSLLPQHKALIERSAISAHVAEERGYRSVETKAELERLGFGRNQRSVPALLIPQYNVHGETAGYLIRPDEPRQIRGRICKYEMPSGAQMLLDIPPSVRQCIGDPEIPIFITEGSRKADSAASRGLACISLTGVWCWRGTNDRGGKVALPDFESVALEDREVYVVFDSDVMTKESVHSAFARLSEFLKTRKARVRLIYLPPGPGGAKVGLDDFLAKDGDVAGLMEHARSDLRKLAGAEMDAPYEISHGGITWNKNAETQVRLTNFEATIVSDVTIDDGVEAEQFFEVEASLRGTRRNFEVEASRFATMHWAIEKLGAGAIIEPGFGVKDRARHAIQTLSGEVPTKTAYGHLGWREIDGQHYYLHAGGAIGATETRDDIEVAVSEPLQAFVLPASPVGEDLHRAIRTTLSLTDLVKGEVAYTLIGLLGRAPLGNFDSTIWLFGETGTFKSELAALCQQHWGPGLDARHLPASFTATANFNEGLLFEAKDALTVVDDFAPDGTSFDVQKAQKDLARLLRGQGNNQGRGRMRADSRLRVPKPSRSAPLVTAEELPQGHSIRARSVLLGLQEGDIDTARLTRLQALAAEGVLAQSMTAYIRHLAGNIDGHRDSLKSEAIARRAELAGDGLHKRTPGALAELEIGVERFIGFAAEAGAITDAEADEHRKAARRAIVQVGRLQAVYLSSGEPATRFIELLGSVLSSGGAHIADPGGANPREPGVWGWRHIETGDSASWRAQGPRIGWTDGEDLWLDPDASLAAVQELSRRAAEPYTISRTTLAKRLAERGLLASTDLETNRECVAIRKSIGGARMQVLHLKASLLVSEFQPETALFDDGRDGRVPEREGDLGDMEGGEVDQAPTPSAEGPNGGGPDQPDHIHPATADEEAEIQRLVRKFNAQSDPGL